VLTHGSIKNGRIDAAARGRVRVSGVFAARARFVSTVDGFRLWWYNTFSDFHARRAERRVVFDVRLGDVSFVELAFAFTDVQIYRYRYRYRRRTGGCFKAAFQWSYSPASTMSNTAPS
jgi:hypothetical protein